MGPRGGTLHQQHSDYIARDVSRTKTAKDKASVTVLLVDDVSRVKGGLICAVL